MVFKIKKIIFFVMCIFVFDTKSFAVGHQPCLDPFSTVDWSFFFDEFLIGTYGFGDNKIPLCQCVVDNGGGQPDVGVKMRIVDMTGFAEATDTPFYFPCFMKNSPNKVAVKKRGNKFSNGNNDTGTYLNAHFISFPVFAVLNLLTNQACLSAGKIDLPFIGEIEPEWYNEFVAAYTHPENTLVSNAIAQVACISDCVTSAFKQPNEALVWCRGCWHSQRAEDGRIEGKVGIVDAAELSVNMLDYMAMTYRSALSIPIMNMPSGVTFPAISTNAIACGTRKYFPKIVKPAYFLQPAYPIPDFAYPIGFPPLVWSNFKTVPSYTSTIFAIWKRKVCCFGALHALHVENAE
jgi:conjugal transfer pilus assembly protein TraU